MAVIPLEQSDDKAGGLVHMKRTRRDPDRHRQRRGRQCYTNWKPLLQAQGWGGGGGQGYSLGSLA